MSRMIRLHLFTLKKTASYYVMHMAVAAGVAYAVTGNWWMALTLSLLEPTVQTVAFFFHEKIWDRRAAVARAIEQPGSSTFRTPAPGAVAG